MKLHRNALVLLALLGALPGSSHVLGRTAAPTVGAAPPVSLAEDDPLEEPEEEAPNCDTVESGPLPPLEGDNECGGAIPPNSPEPPDGAGGGSGSGGPGSGGSASAPGSGGPDDGGPGSPGTPPGSPGSPPNLNGSTGPMSGPRHPGDPGMGAPGAGASGGVTGTGVPGAPGAGAPGEAEAGPQDDGVNKGPISGPHGPKKPDTGVVMLPGLGYKFIEFDLTSEGSSDDVDVELLRCYSSMVNYEGCYRVGEGWISDLAECLVLNEALSGTGGGPAGAPQTGSQLAFRHFSVTQPFNDPDRYLTGDNSGWHSPEWDGKSLYLAGPGDPTGTVYRLEFKDGRRHYFDDEGCLLYRGHRDTEALVTFHYGGANGAMDGFTDSRGQDFVIDSEYVGDEYGRPVYMINSVTDPRGGTVTYLRDAADQLIGVELPAREVVINAPWTGSEGNPQPGGSSHPNFQSSFESPLRTYEYQSPSGKLTKVIDGTGQVESEVVYFDQPISQNIGSYPDLTGLVLAPTNGTQVRQVRGAATDNVWSYASFTSNQLGYSQPFLGEVDPRGFLTYFVTDGQGNVVQKDLLLQSTDPAVPSRTIAGVDRWTTQYVRDANCGCGLIEEIIEPDGGRTQLTYDSDYDLLAVTEYGPSGTGEKLEWTWTYDSEDRVHTEASPWANAQSNPADYTWTYTYAPDTDPSNSGGQVLTATTPAGGLHGADVEHRWVSDTKGRMLEYEGPEHDSAGSGAYFAWEYYGENEGTNSDLAKRFIERRDGSIWSESTYDANGWIVTTTTNTGAVFTETRNAAGLLERWDGPDRGSQRYFIELDYDGAGFLANERASFYGTAPASSGTDTPVLVESSYFYDGEGRPTRAELEVEPGIRAVETMAYDPKGDPRLNTEADGRVIMTLRDERGLAWKVWDSVQELSDVTGRELEYRADGEVSQMVDWQEHDGSGAIWNEAAHEKSYVVFSYDDLDRLIAVEHLDPANTSGTPLTRVEVDLGQNSPRPIRFVTQVPVNGSLTEVESTALTYGDWHERPTKRVRTIRTDDGSAVRRVLTTHFDYTPSGFPESVRVWPPGDPLELDPKGTLYASFEYEDWGVTNRVVDEHGNAVELEYASATGYLEVQRTVQSDPVSGVPLVRERQFTHDGAGRFTQVDYIAPGEATRTVHYEYNSFDQVIAAVNAKGQRWEADYRWDGLMTETRSGILPGGGAPLRTELFAYSPGGLLRSATDDRGNTVQWEHDGQDRVTKEVQPDGTAWEWSHHKNGELLDTTTPSGRYLWFGYDERGFADSRKIWRNGLPAGQDPSTATNFTSEDTLSWSTRGNLESISNFMTTPGSVIGGPGAGSYSSLLEFERDEDGTLNAEIQDGTRVEYGRDALGRVTSLTVPATGYTVYYQYDDRNRVVAVADNPNFTNPISELAYVGPGSAVRRQILGDGTVLDVARNGFGEVVDLDTHTGAPAGGLLGGPPTGPELFRHEVTRDSTGQIVATERHHDGVGDVFLYDELERLKSVVLGSNDPAAELQNPLSTVFDFARTYSLDGDSHREVVTTTPYGGTPETEVYTTAPQRHQYISITDSAGTRSRGYDLDGNVNVDGNKRFYYDDLDRLVRVERGIQQGPVTAVQVLASYRYDGLGRRIFKKVGNRTYRYTYAGDWLIQEHSKLQGQPEILEASYVYTIGVDGLVLSYRLDRADLDSDGVVAEYIELYHHKDRQGSVQDLTLNDGTVVESYRYDAYGQPTIFDASGSVSTAAPSGNAFLYTGREYDAETRLYHMRARAYDPSLGTFLQEDPLGYADGLNPVAYVGGNPLAYTDPFGTSAVSDAVDDVVGFLERNRDIIGAVAGLAADIISPLQGIIDLLSSVTGKDISGWISGGFRGSADDLSWWQRAKRGFRGAINTLGGVVNVVRKLKGIKEKVEDLVDVARMVQEGDVAGLALRGLNRSGKKGCFVAGTPVSTPDGPVLIEELKVGDRVEDTGLREFDDRVEPGNYWIVEGVVVNGVGLGARMSLLASELGHGEGPHVGSVVEVSLSGLEVNGLLLVRAVRSRKISAGHGNLVTAVIRRSVERVATIKLSSGESLVCSVDHPFKVTGSFDEWRPARSLRLGDSLVSTGECASQTVVSVGFSQSPAEVYNCSVEVAHSFFVGYDAILVHNSQDCGPPGGQRRKASTPKSSLPRAGNGDYLPDPSATGAHSTLGSRVGRDGNRYTQGATFDRSGTFQGRTDVTNHGRADHSSPHFHPATSPNSVGPHQSIK